MFYDDQMLDLSLSFNYNELFTINSCYSLSPSDSYYLELLFNQFLHSWFFALCASRSYKLFFLVTIFLGISWIIVSTNNSYTILVDGLNNKRGLVHHKSFA